MLTVGGSASARRPSRQIDVLGDRHGLEEAFDLAVLGDVDDAVADGRPRHAVAHRTGRSSRTCPPWKRSRFSTPATTFAASVRPEPIRPKTPVIWPAKTEKDVLRTTLPIDRFWTLSTFSPAGRGLPVLVRTVEFVGERAADHGAHDLLAVEGRRDVGHDMLAVAHDGDAVGDLQRLLQRMRDEDDRDAARLQPLDQREELVLLLRRQRRRRLVEDDDLGVVMHRPRDLDHLLLAGAEAGHHGGRIDVEVERLQELLAGDVDAAQPVEALVVGQVDVLRDGQRRHQAGLLVDHRDAALQRFRRRCRARPSAPSIQISPAVGCDDAGQHLGQRRLAGAVLAEQRMHLAAMQREGDVLDRRHAAILLGARCGAPGSASCPASQVRRAAKRDDDAIATRRDEELAPMLGDAVTPCVRPSARLCRLERGWNAWSSLTQSPADMVGAHGLSMPRCFTPPPCSDS